MKRMKAYQPNECHQSASPREDCIDQDGQHHRAGAAQAIADHAENKSAGGPAEEKDRSDVAAVFFDIGFLFEREL